MKKWWLFLLLVCLLAGCATFAQGEDAAMQITGVAVNSFIAEPYNGADFKPSNLIDGQSDTCWQVRLRNGMQLSDIFVDLILEKPCDVHQLWIKNGFWRYTKGYNQYVRNSRVKTLGVSVQTEGSSSFTQVGTFDLPNLPHWSDTSKPDSDWLRFDLEGCERVVKVRLTILAIHKGNRYPNDIAISEVQVMGSVSGYLEYRIQCVDQSGQAVPGVSLMLMSSAGTQTLTTDSAGQVVFSGKPDSYRVFVTGVPAGYQTDMLQGYALPEDGSPLQIALTR